MTVELMDGTGTPRGATAIQASRNVIGKVVTDEAMTVELMDGTGTLTGATAIQASRNVIGKVFILLFMLKIGWLRSRDSRNPDNKFSKTAKREILGL